MRGCCSWGIALSGVMLFVAGCGGSGEVAEHAPARKALPLAVPKVSEAPPPAQNVASVAAAVPQTPPAVFSIDGGYILYGDENGAVRMVETEKGVLRRRFRSAERNLLRVAIDDASETIAAGYASGQLCIWKQVSQEGLDAFQRASLQKGEPFASFLRIPGRSKAWTCFPMVRAPSPVGLMDACGSGALPAPCPKNWRESTTEPWAPWPSAVRAPWWWRAETTEK